MASEYVSLAVVKELLENQERVPKQFIEFHTSSVKEEITSLRKYADEVKTSLVFSQKEIDDIKENCYLQGGTSILGSRGGLDLASSLEAKFGVRSPNKRKNLGSSGTTIGKNWDIIPSIQENTQNSVTIHRDLPHRFWGHT